MNNTTVEQTNVEKKNIKPLVISLVIAAIVVGAAVVAFVFNKSPKEMFLAAEYKYWQNEWVKIQEDYEDDYLLTKRMLNNPFTSQTKVSGDFQIQGNMDEYEQQYVDYIRGVIKESGIIIKGVSDPNQEREFAQLSYQVKGNELFNAEFFLDPQHFAFKVPELFDKYILMENGNLEAGMEKLTGEYDGPNRFLTGKDYRETFNFSSEELQVIGKKYGQYFIKNLREEEITFAKNVDYKSPEGTVKLDRLSLHMPERRVKDCLKGLFETLKSDEYTLKLLTENISNYATLMKDTGYLEPEDLNDLDDQEYLISEIKNNLDTLIESLYDLEMSDGLTIELLVDKKKNIIKQDINFVLGDMEDKVAFDITRENWKGKEGGTENRTSILIKPRGTGERSELRYLAEIKTAPQAAESKTDAVYSLKLYDYGEEVVNLRAELDTTESKAETGKKKISTDFNVYLNNMQLDYETYLDKISGNITRVADANANQDRHEDNTEIEINVAIDSYEPRNFNIKLNLDKEVDFTEDLSFPAFDETTSLDLTNASEEEVYKWQYQVQSSMEEFLNKNQNIFSY